MPWWAWVALVVLFVLFALAWIANAYIVIRLHGQNNVTKVELCKLYVLTHNRIPDTCLHL